MEYFASMKQENEEEYREACEFAIQQTVCIQKLFSGDDGEIGLKAIDGITGHGNDTFDPDPYKSAYKAGKRAVSVILRDIIERDVKEVRKQMNERKENE